MSTGQQRARIGRSGVVERELAHGDAAQVPEMGAAAEQAPEIRSERPHVRARRAHDVDRQHTRLGTGLDAERVNCHGPRCALDLDALACELVQAVARRP